MAPNVNSKNYKFLYCNYVSVKIGLFNTCMVLYYFGFIFMMYSRNTRQSLMNSNITDITIVTNSIVVMPYTT